jgi:3'-phosphoadenosine 5'-phosphosulfate sulfotransferase (PAPS reductase)/FAD synthetase
MRHIVSFSGGKDSTAMLLMLLEKRYPVDEIRCFDSGWEFPQMYEHWRKVEHYIGREITIVKPKKSFVHWLLHQKVISRKGENKGQVHRIGNGWPSPMRRWCTRQKMDALYRNRRDCVWYIGLAADEQGRTFKSVSEVRGGRRIYPLIEWGMTEENCLEYCYEKGFDFGGLYKHFKRVSCFCCPLQSMSDLRQLRTYFPEQWAQMLEWDRQIQNNRGFRGYDTVADLEEFFGFEDRQTKLFPKLEGEEEVLGNED